METVLEEAPTEEASGADVLDIMSLLKRSVEKAGKEKEQKPASAPEPAAAASPSGASEQVSPRKRAPARSRSRKTA
jgi:hypothetical protein